MTNRDDTEPRCVQEIGVGQGRRRRCKFKAVNGEYCTRHANDPRRRIRERLAALAAQAATGKG